MNKVHIRNVKLRNYKSIACCNVELGSVSVLVGRNGAGKSNFLDALHFVKDALESTLDSAVRLRGGIDNVRRRSTGHPHNFSIELTVVLDDLRVAEFGFEVTTLKNRKLLVKKETLSIKGGDGRSSVFYLVSEGVVEKSSYDPMPPVSSDRLYLTNAAGLPDFRPVYEALLKTGFYNLNPDVIREPQSPDSGALLSRSGSNISSVIEALRADDPQSLGRINEYLRLIVPGIEGVKRVSVGPKETLEFRQEVSGSPHPWKFHAANMSDGTLRALGCLVAISQLAGGHSAIRFAGIEEPETALHPAAAGCLMDAVCECSERTQILLTTHSASLLDQIDPDKCHMLAVQSEKGVSVIGPVDEASLSVIRDHLYTAGDLLRQDQLTVDPVYLQQALDLNI